MHDWNDDHCLLVLQNCYTALPASGGKLIMVDLILPVETPSQVTFTFQMDFTVLLHCANGRERSQAELEALVTRAGFATFHVVGDAGMGFFAMEASKS